MHAVKGKPQGESLLRTKLFVPALRPDLIRRQRLVESLQSDWVQSGRFNRRLTLVSAPAGYGKTTLVIQWLSNAEVPAAWVTLEPAENDPIRFLVYIVAALRTVDADIGTGVQAMLQAPQQPPREVILGQLVNELAAYPNCLVLVLDDYHVIQEVAVHEILNFLVEHLPENIHIVLTSREDPPLPLHRLQARRQMQGVRQQDLSFQVEEVIELFRSHLEIELSHQEAELLTRRTEGWITGLQLAALSMRSVSDREEFIRSFTGSNRYILDYLFEEVFETQSQPLKNFLLKTSILDRICSDLADDLTQQDDSQTILEKLEQSNFFIIPLDMSRRWYRYHRLFADLLQHRLQQSSYNADELHEKASRWYADHEFEEEAIEHALAGGHWNLAGELIEAASQEHLQKGELSTLLRWYRRVPEEVILSRPDWALSYAWPLILIGQVQEADRVLARLKRMPVPEGHVLHGHIAAAEAYLRRSTGDLDQTVEHTKSALKLLPESDVETRGPLLVNLGLIIWHQGELNEARQALEDALSIASIGHNQYLHHTALLFMARSLASGGHFRQASSYLEQAEKIGDRVPTAILSFCDMAEIHFLQGRLDQAWQHLEKARKISEAVGNQEFMCACWILQALFHLSLQDPEAAYTALEPALVISQSEGFPPLTLARVMACRVQTAIAQGEIKLARQIYDQIPVPHDAGTFTRFLDLNQARLLLAEGKLPQAGRYLQKTLDLAEHKGWGYGLHLIHILLAAAAEEREDAIRHLQSAFQIGQPEGLVRTYISQKEKLTPLLHEAARRGIEVDYVGRILETMDTVSRQPGLIDGIYEPLSDRELEVLRLVAAGLSNRKIAAELVISLGTAKSHLHHIFGKLDVTRRTQAVAKARELGLI
ncbi:MAG: LuxR C-terminal-related transcriptional regulator [Anaerolineales bacterium]